MRTLSLAGTLSLLLAAIGGPSSVLAGPATILADNAATSTPAPPSGKAPDAVAYPNSPNGSPATTSKGAPVVTDKAACNGTGTTASCPDSPSPSAKADTSDTVKATPTTVNAP